MSGGGEDRGRSCEQRTVSVRLEGGGRVHGRCRSHFRLCSAGLVHVHPAVCLLTDRVQCSLHDWHDAECLTYIYSLGTHRTHDVGIAVTPSYS